MDRGTQNLLAEGITSLQLILQPQNDCHCVIFDSEFEWLSKSHFPSLSQSEAYVFNCLTLSPQEKVHSTQ